MPTEDSLVDTTTGKGLFVGADHIIDMTVSQEDGYTPRDITGWTIILDIRETDITGVAKLSVTGVVSGVFNIDPSLNTQIVTFTISAALVAATIFTGDDPAMRYSIERRDAGSIQPLRFGDAILTRLTQV